MDSNGITAGGYSGGGLDGEEDEPTRACLTFEDPAHPSGLLHSLNMMRKDRTFCDVTLEVGKAGGVSAHRAVLAGVSPHLMELFSAEGAAKEPHLSFRLNGAFEKEAVEKLVEYAYTSRLDLEPEEVKSVLVAATQLKMDRVARICAGYLVDTLSPATAIEVRALPGVSKDKALVSKIDGFICKNFEEIVKTSKFLSLPCARMEVLSQSLAEMRLVSPDSVCQLAFDWLCKAHEETTLQELIEKTHMLYLALDNSLQDCSELPTGDVGDTELVQDYKRLSKAISLGNKKKKKGAATKPRVLLYSRNISNDTEALDDRKLVAATGLKEQTVLGLGFLSGRALGLSVLLRLNRDAGPGEGAQAPEMYQELAAMGSVKCGAGCANLGGALLVCGGYDRGECLRSVEIYSPSKNEWSPLAPMLEARGRFNIAVIEEKVYAVGGCNGTTELSTVEVFSAEQGAWESVASLPLARSNLGVCDVGGLLYCIGGFNGQVGIKQCDVFDPKAGTWTSIAPLQTGRYQSGCCGYQGQVWVVGGCDGWNNLTSVEVYDPVAGSWAYAQPMSTPRRGCGLALFCDKLYAVGGSDGTHSLASTEVYDPQRQAWCPGPDMSVSRSNVGVASILRRLYAVGGFSGKTFLNSIEFLEEGSEEWNAFTINNKDE